jgi:hypothetical protein
MKRIVVGLLLVWLVQSLASLIPERAQPKDREWILKNRNRFHSGLLAHSVM